MAFQCSRCGNTEPQLEEKPLGGKLGERIQQNVCAPCWEEWDQQQLMIINEYQLNMAVPQHFDMLVAEMLKYFQLEPQSG